MERVLFSDTHGDSFILNVLPDNVTSGIMTPLNAGHVPATAEACGYTGDGLRAWKSSAAGRTYYLYDGADPVAELDANGTLQATNTFGAQGLVSRHTTATNRSVFYTFDERGNVAQRLDAGGNVLSTDLYDAFGARTGTAPASDPWGFGAQWGYQTDNETGLVLCTHRFYDPQQGRFLTRDPLGYDGGVNLYGYTGNNPVNWSDPSGYAPGRAGGKPPVSAPVHWLHPGGPYHPGVPEHPKGVDIFDNIALAQGQEGLLGLGTVHWYHDQVQTGGPWDYKQWGLHYLPTSGSASGTYQYDDFGNFNYGAPSAAMGAPLWFALKRLMKHICMTIMVNRQTRMTMAMTGS